jgi:ERCC4-type nuclease
VNEVAVSYRYSETEMKALLSSIVLLVDTREQQNKHILDYFRLKNISYEIKKLDCGDYSAYLPSNQELGIHRNLYFSAVIERKNSVDELASTIKERTRFENELIRSQRNPFLLLVEAQNGYHDMVTGNYRSEFSPQALLGSMKTFEARYGFQTVFIDPATSGNYIYYHFYYKIRESLKCGFNKNLGL